MKLVIIKSTSSGYRRFGRAWGSETMVEIRDFDGARPNAKSPGVFVISSAELQGIHARKKTPLTAVDAEQDVQEASERAAELAAMDAESEAGRKHLSDLRAQIASARRELEAVEARVKVEQKKADDAKADVAKAKSAIAKLDKQQRQKSR